MEILEKLEKELSLKQLQITSLLTITQAINNNISAAELYEMFSKFLSWEMGVKSMGLFILDESDEWSCVKNFSFPENIEINKLTNTLLNYNRLHTIKAADPEILHDFNLIIPVYHKEKPISYALIGGINEEDRYNKIQFIQSITNIISVALENKRLFKKQIEQEALKKEMELASNVQQMLIPDSLPKGEGFELSSIYKPHYNVGGDYFDFIQFDKDRFAFCIADISGKGVAAALLMANFQAIIQSLIYQYRDLPTFVFALNQAVYRITKSDKFITFFIGEVDLQKGELKYVNAGHFPPILHTGDQRINLDKGCMILGALDELPEIEEGREKLNRDSLVLTFTDGLTDLKSEEGDYFDEKQIDKFVDKHYKLSAEDFNQKLLEKLESFKGDEAFTDDIAILTCKINLK